MRRAKSLPSSCNQRTACCGTQKKCLPLLPSGPGGVYTFLLRRAIPWLQENSKVERVDAVYFSIDIPGFNTGVA